MTHNDAFLRAIIENPDDDTPRVIYADWLDEHGDTARAEFIRVQIELAGLPIYDRRRPALLRREYELLNDGWPRWAAPLIGRIRRWWFLRGFVEKVRMETAHFLEDAKMLFGHSPVCELEADLATLQDVKALAASPFLERLTTLDLSHSQAGNAGVQALLSSPYLNRLRRLNLQFNKLETAGLTAFSKSSHLPALEELDLNANDLSSKALIAFAAAAQLPLLHRLNWMNNSSTADGLRALGESSLAGQLTALQLSEAGDEELAALLSANRLKNLEELEFRWPKITSRGLAGLANNESLRSLRKLIVPSSQIGDSGAAELSASPLAERLRELWLCGLTGNGVQSLVAGMRSGSLQVLNLNYHNAVCDDGCRTLAEAEGLRGLQGLRMARCGITAKGVRAILTSRLIDQLGYLDLEENAIGSQAAHELDARLGEYVRHDYMDEGCPTESEWARHHLKANSPRCLHSVVARLGTPLAQKVTTKLMGSDPEWFAFELSHTKCEEHTELLGYVVNTDVFVGPLAIRWEPSGEVVELFDTEQHGYAGECGGSATITGRGERQAWRCPHDGCLDHTFVVCFLYSDEKPEHPFKRCLPIQEQFRGFTVGAYCHDRDAVQCVASFECR
jgi:uncharacterized protein (TIGR02996 family)